MFYKSLHQVEEPPSLIRLKLVMKNGSRRLAKLNNSLEHNLRIRNSSDYLGNITSLSPETGAIHLYISHDATYSEGFNIKMILQIYF